MFGLVLASNGFALVTTAPLIFGAAGVTSRETSSILFSPCLLFMSIRLETEPMNSSVPSIPIIRPSAWKTPLRYSPRYLLFRYSSTNQNDRERMTTDWTMITIFEADPCPAVGPVLTLESNRSSLSTTSTKHRFSVKMNETSDKNPQYLFFSWDQTPSQNCRCNVEYQDSFLSKPS